MARVRTAIVAGVGAVALLVPVVAHAGANKQHYGHHPFKVHKNASTSPVGLSPAAIKRAYNFPTSLTAGAGGTIAFVDAYDDPTAEADLNTFSTQYGLPACTTANGCFRKVNQTGGTSAPKADPGWALEISL